MARIQVYTCFSILLLLFLTCCCTSKTIVDNQLQDSTYGLVADTLQPDQIILDSTTTIICVRHTEDIEEGMDPVLSDKGLYRAEILKDILSLVDLKAIMSTEFNRTMQTAQPTASNKSLEIFNYTSSNVNNVAEQVLITYSGKAVMIVGHSNTIPLLLNQFTGGNNFQTIPHNQYNNLFVVSAKELGDAEVLQITYGD